MFGNSDEVYEKLQVDADAAILDATVTSEFNRPILNRLRDFVAVAITSLKLYPSSMTLQLVLVDRIEIKVAGLSTAVVVFAPAEQVVAEVYLNKMADTKHLPFPRVLKHDVTFTTLPIAYAVYSFIAGTPLSSVEDETMQRVAAKQVGRTMRSLHIIAAHGLGAPQLSGKWANRAWSAVIVQWLTETGDYDRLMEMIGVRTFSQLIDHTIKHPSLQQFTSNVLLGDIRQSAIMVLVHGHIQVEGLTRSGRIVAGDAMFDVASSMRNSLGSAFRQGFFEGYTMHAPLTSDEIARVKRYALLWRVVDSARLITQSSEKDVLAQSVSHVLAEFAAATP